MAQVASARRVVRVHNPRHHKKRRNAAHGKKRLSAKQIRFFGTPAQKAGLKRSRAAKRIHNVRRKAAKSAARARKRTRSVASHRPRRHVSNPKPRRTRRKRAVAKKRRSHRHSNPALLVTLGATNPRKRRKTVAKHRKRNRRRTVHASHAHHTKRRRRRNPTRVYVMGRKGNRRTGRRHNPMLFGATVSGKDFGLSILGGLVGVWATKQIASLVPATLVSSPYLSAAVQAIAAYFEGWLASKANPRFGSAVAFGGYMQAGSTLLNQLAPSLPIGLGDFVPARFAEPENPIRRAMFAQAAASAAAAAGPATTLNAYGNAY